MKMPADTPHRDVTGWKVALIGLFLLSVVALTMWWTSRLASTRDVMGKPGMFPREGSGVVAMESAPTVHEAREAAPAVPRVVTSLDELAQISDADALEARDVVLRVRVLRVLGNYTFIVGTEQNAAVVTLFGEVTGRQPETKTEIRAGDNIIVYGVIRRLRDIESIEEIATLATDERAELQRHDVYISALRVVQLGPSS